MRDLHAKWGQAIRYHRERAGWTQDELAAKLGVTHAAVSYWENGVRAPRDEYKLALAEVFGVPASALFPLMAVKR